MRSFLFHNDKKTIKDEIALLLFILTCIGAGIIIYIFAPSNWIIKENNIKIFGVLWIITGVMFIPGLIYRLRTNETTKK